MTSLMYLSLNNWVIIATGTLRKKKGYSGVSVYTRLKPEEIVVGLGDEKFD